MTVRNVLNVTAVCVRIYREALRLSSFKLSCNSVGIIPIVDGTNSHSCPITGLERPVGLQEVEAASISRQWTYEGGKVVSRMYRPSLPLFLTPQGKIPGTHFC